MIITDCFFFVCLSIVFCLLYCALYRLLGLEAIHLDCDHRFLGNTGILVL